MIKLTATRLLLMTCIVVGLGFISSCDKDDEVNSGKVELLSFGPTGANVGDTLQFIGNNLHKVNSIELTGATVNKADFKQQTSEVILILVPASTEKGKVTLKTDEGDIVSITELNIGVTVDITSITAQARPGENITLTGNYLNWIRSITFTRDKVVTSFVSQSMTQLVVKVPDDAQTGPLTISYAGTDSAVFETDDTLKVTLPAVTALAPNPIKHQTNLTVTGTNLDLVKNIAFTGVTTPVTAFVSQNATQVVVKVPAGAKTGKLTLGVASGVTVTTTQDMQVVLPTITALSPNPVSPLSDITITGTNLDLVTGVAFTGITLPVTTFTSQSATQIKVTVPDGTLKGKVTLNVLNSTLNVVSDDVLDINGGLPPLADFAYAIYTDAIQNSWGDWGWTTRDMASTQLVRQGTKSIKSTYADNGYQGLRFHLDAGISTAAYTKFEFSVFGEPGTGGKKINVITNEGWSNAVQVTIVEGEWTTFSVDVSTLYTPAVIKDIILQSAGWTGVIHVDHIGFR